MDVRPIRFHAEEIAHDVPVAHAVLGLARGRKGNVVIRQVQGIDVGHARRPGQLTQARAVRLDLVDMVVLALVPAHGEENSFPGKVDLRIPHHTGALDQGRGLPRGHVEDPQRAWATEFAGVDLAGLENGSGVVVIRWVLRPAHVENAQLAEGRVGEQNARAEGRDILPQLLGARGEGRHRFLPLADGIQPSAQGSHFGGKTTPSLALGGELALAGPQAGLQRRHIDAGQRFLQRAPRGFLGKASLQTGRCLGVDGALHLHVVQGHMPPTGRVLVHDLQVDLLAH